MRAIAVFGSINVDLNLSVQCHPLPGETVLGRGGLISPGGKGANQALAARLAGIPVSMLGQVGEDTNAQLSMRLLSQFGVDLSHVQTVPGATGMAVVSVDAKGENSIIVVPGANGAMKAAELEWVDSALQTAEILVMQAEVPVDCIMTVARKALDAGKRIVFNLAPAINVDPWILHHSDPLVVNEHEGRTAGNCLGLPTAIKNNAEFVKQLLSAGVPSVVMTLGSRGAIVGFRDAIGELKCESINAVSTRVVDTVGAGDAFVGVLAKELAEGRTLVDAAKSAVVFAGATVRFTGAQSSYRQAKDFLEAVDQHEEVWNS